MRINAEYKKIAVLGVLIIFVLTTVLAGKGVFEKDIQTSVSYGSDEQIVDSQNNGRDEEQVAEIRECIEAGLEYLNQTQHPDGGWAANYGKNTNMVGGALRAFVDYNATDPRWQDAIEGAVRFLRFCWHDPDDYNSQSDKDRYGGVINNDVFHPTYTHGTMYSQGAATAALIDYYFHTRDLSILPYINASVDLIVRSQNTPYKPNTMGGPRSQGGWRYEPWTTSSDTSLSGWNMHAIILAESSGIYDVPDWAFEYSERWLQSCSSGSGYGYSGAYTSNTNTAVGTYCMLLMGKGNEGHVQGALNSIKGWGPTYRPTSFYYTYHATIAMYLVGGQEWKDWYEEVADMLMGNQNQDGSWNGEYGVIWGTAMAINTLNLGINKPNEVTLEPQKGEDDKEDDMVKMVQPEHTVTYNITVGSSLGFVENPLSRPYEEKDTIELTVSDPLPGWTAELDTPNTEDDGEIQPDGSRLWWVKLNMRETDNVTLRVTAPPLGKVSEPCVVYVIARLTNEYGITQDKIATVSILDIDVNFDLDFIADKDEFTGLKMGTIAPGERKIYHAEVHNNGNVNDTYDIKLAFPSNWGVMFDDSTDICNVTLGKKGGSHNVKVINITVEAPITAKQGERIDLTITGTSRMYNSLGLGTLRRSDTLSLTITGLPEIEISCEDDVQHVDPGQIVEFEITVKNNYDSALDIVFSFTGTGTVVNSENVLSEEWSAAFSADNNNIEIKSSDVKKITFQVAAPTYVRAGIRTVIKINAIGYDDFSRDYEATPISVTAISNLVSKISTIATPTTQTCAPGGDVDYIVRILNQGNGDEIVDTKVIDMPLSWSSEFNVSSVVLGPYMNGSIRLTIMLPESALADANPATEEFDPYNIGLNFTSRDKTLNYGETRYVKLYVERKSNFIISTETSEKNAPPQSECDFICKVENAGNAFDEVKLVFDYDSGNENMDLEWKAYFPFISLTQKIESITKMTSLNFTNIVDLRGRDAGVLYVPTEDTPPDELLIKLGVGDVVYVGMRIEVPVNKREGQFDFSVLAVREGDVEPEDNTERFKIIIIMPDLKLDEVLGITHTSLEIGTIASFVVRVKNIGALTANDVGLSLYIDNKEVDSQILPRLGGTNERDSLDSKICTFVWTVTSGDHDIRVAVDPDNELVEENEDNNVIETTINVGQEGIFGFTSDSAPMIAFIIILIGLMACAVVYVVRHYQTRY